jgi:hypothetical protein
VSHSRLASQGEELEEEVVEETRGTPEYDLHVA